MNLSRALRLSSSSCLAFAGSGGKTTALFQLARELPPPVIVTATTHLHIDQIKLADSHWIAKKTEDLSNLEQNRDGVMLVTGAISGDKTLGVSEKVLYWLHEVGRNQHISLLIEADGSRQKPLKAPAEHEPPIPEFVNTVVLVAGMSGLGKPLTDEFVHRPEIFARLSGLQPGEIVTLEALTRVLTHPKGGLKNIPSEARRVVLLNQADTPGLQAQAKSLAEQLLPSYHAIVIASLNPPPKISNPPAGTPGGQQPKIQAVIESVAGIVLAAGASSRFGQPKQILDWRGQPFVRAVAQTARSAGLSPVVIVTGAESETVAMAVKDLPITIAYNADWQSGQSTSIRAGLRALPPETGAAIFLLADQPQVTPAILRALVEHHSAHLSPIVSPLVNDRRANPVLFDCITFPDLSSLTGDMGGRGIFSKHPIAYLPWHDANLLIDIDTPEDYRRLVE